MKFGIREIADFVFRARTDIELAGKKFYKGEPVIIFDTLKTSSLEGATTTVYAQGGKGNARLMAWDGERTLTLNMEDALLSIESFTLLAGAESAVKSNAVIHHIEAKEAKYDSTASSLTITYDSAIASQPDDLKTCYVMLTDDNGDVISEPYLGLADSKNIVVKSATINGVAYVPDFTSIKLGADETTKTVAVLVDYYTSGKATEINISDEIKSHNFYMEGATLFRDRDGKDHAAEVIIPNGKVQSNFTLSMAATGDPSTFNFVVDAFPGRANGDVSNTLAKIQIIDADSSADADGARTATPAK